MKGKVEHSIALAEAQRVVTILQPRCEKIEIAGSLRRLKPYVGDIEIVCLPKQYKATLFGDMEYKKLPVEKLGGKEILGGDKYKKIMLPCEIQLDLFIVLPPAQFGVIFAIRTGSAEFSKQLVTKKMYDGLLPNNMYVADGCLCKGGERLTTPTEEVLFEQTGIRWIPPENR